MRNHNEKARDIARSVLPSKATERSRFARRQAHKSERARVRGALRAVAKGAAIDPIEDALDYTCKADVLRMRRNRREADKLAPLFRWADAVLDADEDLRNGPADARRAFFSSVLPDGLIGNHAMTHLAGYVYGDNYYWSPIRRYPQQYRPPSDAEIAKQLLELGLHLALNKQLRALAPHIEANRVLVCSSSHVDAVSGDRVYIPMHYEDRDEPYLRRLLLGDFDVDAFVREASHEKLRVMRELWNKHVGRQQNEPNS